MLDPNYYKKLPKKRMGVGALLFNREKELLIVKPHYKDHWSVPGGVVDSGESPRQACIREVKEEIGLDISIVKFLCVDYKPYNSKKDESLQFIFYGGVLNKKQINAIAIPTDELSEYTFAKVEDAIPLLSKNSGQRIPKCLRALKRNTAIYLENSVG